ncbi:lipopolysaccharide biosynthesis protein [Thalassotalea sp. PS06]|uniref:lipopolysaccharide biosynthesis protein n=1 Tax=Thalassotalea sp. PS06 TaxID=2594005 RepID=UPI0011658712|nr:polysaccharide biosynthesis C-terminal domain-containing protein [Thalassotalea sp. PS06]QDO99973.1 oligosaccharide flippase family protein [Thalassotalea sp. PS06]
MKELLLKSTAFRFLERFVLLFISLLLTPFMINHLGEDGYGLWILILSVLTWFNVVNLGFPVAVQRNITLALEENDNDQVNRVFSTSIALFFALGLLAAGGLLVLAQFPQWLGVPGPMEVTVTYCFYFFTLKIIWGFLMNCLHGFYAAVLRFDIDANISSLNAILKALGVFVFLPSMDIFGAVAATLAADAITNTYKLYWVRKNYPQLRFSKSLISRAEFSNLFHFSKHVVALGIARTINAKSDPVIVTRIFDVASVTMFSIANRLAHHVEAFVGSVSGIFQPIFTRMFARGANMERFFHQVTSLNIFICATFFMPLFVLSPLFIPLWVGEQFLPATQLIGFFVFGYLCIAAGSGIKNVLLAQANHKWLSVANLIGAIVHILLSIYLAQDYGLIGVAMGTPIGFLVSELVIKCYLLKHYCGFRLWPIYFRFLSAAVIVFGFGYPIKTWILQYATPGWGTFIVYGLILFPVMALVNYFLLLDRGVKEKLADMLNQFRQGQLKSKQVTK